MVSALVLMVALGAAQPAQVGNSAGEESAEALIGKQRALLRIGPTRCPDAGDEIVVCGRRDPDRYRIPEEVRNAPTGAEERSRLLNPGCADIGGRGCRPALIPIITVTGDGVKIGPPRKKP